MVRDFVRQTGVNFEVLRDTDFGYGTFRRAMQEPSVSPFPLDVVIDADGRLISVRGEYDPEALRREIQAALR